MGVPIVESAVIKLTLFTLKIQTGEGEIVPLQQVDGADSIDQITHIPQDEKGKTPDGYMLITQYEPRSRSALHFSVYQFQENNKDEWAVEKQWVDYETWKPRRGVVYLFNAMPPPRVITTIYKDTAAFFDEGEDGFLYRYHIQPKQ